MLTYLLNSVLDDLDNLQDYYENQIKNILSYVKDNIEQYKYGVIIDRYFMKKALGDATEIEFSPEEEEIANRIITKYEIEDKGESFSVSYKINPEEDYSGYEMDPRAARTALLKLIQQPNILRESTIIMLLVKYEEFIAEIYRYLLTKYPQAYLSDKSITYSELVSFESNLEDIKEKIISKEVEDFMHLPISDWYKFFEMKPKADFYFIKEIFDNFKEVYYRRNLIVHNQGRVNEIYLKNIPSCEEKIGDKLDVNDEYIKKALNETRKILIGTIWGLRKTTEDKDSLCSCIFEFGYDCMKKEEWDLSEYIYRMLLSEEGQTAVDKMCEQINMWISIKNGKGLQSIESDIRGLDVSASQAQFSVAKAALLNEFDDVSLYLEEALQKNEINTWSIEDWPLLNQYRESNQYASFREKHKTLFETKEFNPENESVGNEDDILRELGEI